MEEVLERCDRSVKMQKKIGPLCVLALLGAWHLREENRKGYHHAGPKLGCYKAKYYFNTKDFDNTKESCVVYYERDKKLKAKKSATKKPEKR